LVFNTSFTQTNCLNLYFFANENHLQLGFVCSRGASSRVNHPLLFIKLAYPSLAQSFWRLQRISTA
jgi:hypothetical protein